MPEQDKQIEWQQKSTELAEHAHEVASAAARHQE
jgi:hypothetical protein